MSRPLDGAVAVAAIIIVGYECHQMNRKRRLMSIRVKIKLDCKLDRGLRALGRSSPW